MISHQNIIANVEQSLYMRQLKTESPSSYVEPDPNEEERWLGIQYFSMQMHMLTVQ